MQRDGVNKYLPHRFLARQHGSRLACEHCGAQETDPIHTNKLPAVKPRWGPKGQALIEAALVMPILLLLVVGILWLGYIEVMRLELTHAASEGAVAGAMNPGDSCGVAKTSAEKVWALTLDSMTCTVQGQILSLEIKDSLIFPTPWGTQWSLSSTQRAVIR